MSDEVEALIHPGDDGKFWAEVVGLPGCYTQGDNYSKILANLRDAHELCSAVAAAGSAALVPAEGPPELVEGTTAGQLVAALCAGAWSQSGHASASHQLIAQTASGVHLCVPLEEEIVLNSGYRAAVSKFLTGAG